MERILQTPPVIAPVSKYVKRPLWSVMIPTYNCYAFLQQTLESVLIQDPGPDIMQIEVVDDCSSDGDVESLVKEVGKGRIEFYRQAQNVGHHRNFETCLNRSRGEYIHLLHGDDCVLKGFYKEIKKLFSDYPQAGAAFTKNGYLDEWNRMWIPEKTIRNQPGILPNFFYEIAQRQMLQVAAMVVKRKVYEEVGGFFAVNYCEDWEMWIRIASRYPIAYSPDCLALYRTGNGNTGSITSNALIRGDNFKNINKAIEITQHYLPPEKRKQIKNMARKNYSMQIAKAAYKMYNLNRKTAFIQAMGALKMHQNIRTFYWAVRLFLLHIRQMLSRQNKNLPPIQVNTIAG